jgi:uncharacterized protein YhaN
MAIEEKIRELVKEELDTQLEEIRDQMSSISSKIDTIEEETNRKFSLLMNFKKSTLEQLMLEYRKLKNELFQKSEEFDVNVEI